MLRLDHVVWAVPRIAPVVARLGADHGLIALPGGTHPAWGTRNAVVPLSGAYLEIVEVADAEVATHGFGGRVATVAAAGGGLAAWCVAVDDITVFAAGRGLHVTPGSRDTPDGGRLTWRVAGMAEAMASPDLPFMVEWDDPACAPGMLKARHPCGDARVTTLTIATHGAVGEWAYCPELNLGVTTDDGPPGPRSLRLFTDAGDVVVPHPAPPDRVPTS